MMLNESHYAPSRIIWSQKAIILNIDDYTAFCFAVVLYVLMYTQWACNIESVLAVDVEMAES